MLCVSCTSKVDYTENCTNKDPNLSAAKDNWTDELEQTKINTLNKKTKLLVSTLGFLLKTMNGITF